MYRTVQYWEPKSLVKSLHISAQQAKLKSLSLITPIFISAGFSLIIPSPSRLDLHTQAVFWHHPDQAPLSPVEPLFKIGQGKRADVPNRFGCVRLARLPN